MKLLIIYLACLFLFGCNSGGFVLNSEREPQRVVDMDLLASADLGDESLEPAVDVDSVEEDTADQSSNSRDLEGEDHSQRPNSREFGKRVKKEQQEPQVEQEEPRVEQEPQVVQEPQIEQEPQVVQEPQIEQEPQVVQEPRRSQRSFGKRANDSDLVVQEPAPEPVEEEEVVEVQDINNKVDVLFVVDGSFSTKEILMSIPERADGFIPALDEFLDWRVGFIGAHVRKNENKELSPMEIDGAIVLERRYITKGTLSKERIFIDTLTRNSGRRRCAFPPRCGGFKETPLLALSEYILSPTRSVQNGTRFIRDTAHLAIVIVTDNRENKRYGHRVIADEVVDSIRQEFGDEKEFSVHTLTTMNNDCQRQLKGDHFFAEGNRATEMLLLARETGGASLSLCSYDYALPLAKAIEKSVLGEQGVDCNACVDDHNTVAISDLETVVVQERVLPSSM